MARIVWSTHWDRYHKFTTSTLPAIPSVVERECFSQKRQMSPSMNESEWYASCVKWCSSTMSLWRLIKSTRVWQGFLFFWSYNAWASCAQRFRNQIRFVSKSDCTDGMASRPTIPKKFPVRIHIIPVERLKRTHPTLRLNQDCQQRTMISFWSYHIVPKIDKCLPRLRNRKSRRVVMAC